MEHLASRRKTWYLISLIFMVPGLVALFFFGLNLGIDFTGGTLWELEFDRAITTEEIRDILSANGVEGGTIQVSSSGDLSNNVALIRIAEMPEGSAQKTALEDAFTEQIGTYTELAFSTVGSSVSTTIRNRSIFAIVLASIAILLYMAYAFRNTQNPMLYGSAAIVGMVHDILIVLGVFAILGHFFNVEIDALFVTAILTIIGFSVHDTIVVFDRIRENLAKRVEADFEKVVDYSLAQTLVRSLNTSLTVIFTLLALYLFGGGSTRNFVLALLIGIICGTYSSIFNASQLLVSWEKGEIQGLWGRMTGIFRRNPAPA
ncbi:MAG: protein translocase subunit SecF [Thermomicrobiales bacterium]|nr:protein translocase subunit SecF [Thermomicrobiales bacterium]